MNKTNRRAIMQYFYAKLAGAGFSFTVFVFFFTLISSLSLFELSEALSSLWFWGAFYGYGMICSIIIDGISKAWPGVEPWAIFIYSFAGFIPFVILIWPEPEFFFILYAGAIGIVASMLFYYGLKVISNKKWLSILFAIFLPLLLLFVSTQDFSKKKNWEEERGPFTFEAIFSHFDGEHKIPIQLEKGDVLSFNVQFNAKNDGGWGNHFENEKGVYLGMEESGGTLIFIAEADGEYYIVVSGTSVVGGFVVDWDITKGNSR